MDCGMMNGIGSRIFFLGGRAMSAARRRTIGCSSTRFSIAIGRAFPGRFGGPFWFVEKHAPKRYGSTSGCPLNLHGLRRTDTLRTLVVTLSLEPLADSAHWRRVCSPRL